MFFICPKCGTVPKVFPVQVMSLEKTKDAFCYCENVAIDNRNWLSYHLFNYNYEIYITRVPYPNSNRLPATIYFVFRIRIIDFLGQSHWANKNHNHIDLSDEQVEGLDLFSYTNAQELYEFLMRYKAANNVLI